MLSSSSVNLISLMSSWLLTILIGLSVTLEGSPSGILKCSYHFYILSSWKVAFRLALEVVFLSFTSFTVCRAIRDGLSSTKLLILLIWLRRYFSFSIWYVFCLGLKFLDTYIHTYIYFSRVLNIYSVSQK